MYKFQDFKINFCRLCNKKNINKALFLGKSPIGNHLYNNIDEKENVKYPLGLNLCHDCGHLQLSHKLPNTVLFQNNYTYLTGATLVFKNYLENYVNQISEEFVNIDGCKVLEIGSNDGTCLNFFKEKKCEVLGIDPAIEISKIANQNGIDTIPDFFNSKTAKKIHEQYGKFSIITSHNTLAHVDNLLDVFKGVKVLLENDGIFIFEVGYRLDVIENFWFDTVYHEHLDYHALYPLERALKSLGFKVFRVERGDQQGGSIRIYCSLPSSKQEIEKCIFNTIEKEKKMKLFELVTYKKFDESIKTVGIKLSKIISSYKKLGKKIVGYGWPTKAATLMTKFNLNEEHFDFFVEDNQLKQNKFTSLGKIPIYSSEILYEQKPDLIFIFAWNFYQSILEKHIDLRKYGVKFLVPLPKPRIF